MELKSRIFEGPKAGPRLLITGGVHGDEYEPMAALRRLIDLLGEHRICGCVTIVPVVNGPAFARIARTADDGLDLARTCPGRPDGSITERIADALSRLIRQSDYYIDLHTGGSALRLASLAGYMVHSDQRIRDAQRRMARAFNLPLVWGTTPKLEGRSLSVARDASIPAIYVESGGGGACDFNVVESYLTGCLNVMRVLAMIDAPAPRSCVREMVEDQREQSGVLQIQNPSPADGFFEATVKLDAHVRAGDQIGAVSDELGDRTEPIAAEHTGRVIMLRALNRVSRGDALAAILPGDAPRLELYYAD